MPMPAAAAHRYVAVGRPGPAAAPPVGPLADKRGAGQAPESLDAGIEIPVPANPAELVALDDALATLAALDPRAASVAELRVFAGLTIDETAQAMDISPSSVNREWAHACAWLKTDVFAAREP